MCVAINNLIPVWLPLTNKIDTYVHTEAVAATTWTITHNLNTTIPLLQIYNAAGEMLIPDSVTPTSNNIMEVTFNTAIAGTAIVLFGDLMPQSGIGLLEPINGWTVSDISNATYDSKTYDVSIYNNFDGMFMKPDGLTFFLVSVTDDKIYQHSMSSAWDISTASDDGEVLNTTAEGSDTRGIYFKPDGSKMYILKMNPSNSAERKVEQYSLGTAWDVSTATTDSSSYLITESASMSNVTFSTDGDKMFLPDPSQDSVRQYSLGTAWDVSTASYDFQQNVGGLGGTPRDTFFTPNGDQMFLLDNDGAEKIWLYDLSTAFDVSSATFNSKFDFTFSDFPVVIGFSDDGAKMFVGDSNYDIYQYST